MNSRPALGVLVALSLAGAHAAELEPVPAASDLQALGERAREESRPILIAFTERGCSSCEALKEEELKPRRAAGGESPVLIREIMVGRRDRLTDFDGSKVKPVAVATRYDAWGTPTVVLVDAEGQALADPLVGYIVRPMYGAYLDRAITRARERMSASGP